MNGTKLETVQCVKDFGVTTASNLKFFQQCKDAARKANGMLGFYKQKLFVKKKIEVFVPLYSYISLVRPHLEYAVHFWPPHHAKGYSETRGCPVKGYEDDYVLE